MAFATDHIDVLLNDLPEPLLITTTSGEIVFVNAALEILSHYLAADLLGAPVTRLMPQPERRRLDVIAWLERWAEAPDPEQLRYLNLELLREDGARRLVSVRVSRHHRDDETYFIIVLRDVTAERQTVTNLRHAQLIANRIIAIGEDGVISVDAGHRITSWNHRAGQIFGYPSDDVLGQPLGMLLPNVARDSHDALMQGFKEGTEASRFMGQRGEVVGLRKDGSEVPLEIAITKTEVEGQVILSAQVRDISARRAQETALLSSEARFRALFDNALEAIALLSADGSVLEINRAATALLRDYEPGHKFWELNWWPNESESSRAENQARLAESVGEVQRGNTVRSPVLLETAAGSRQIDFSLIPVAANGQVTYIIAEGRDITSLTQ